MNKVILIGRTVADPEKNEYGRGKDSTVVTRVRIAVERRFRKDGDIEADFINIVAFGKTAETIAGYVSKGDEVKIVGRLQTGSYENKDGNKVYTTDVIVEDFEFGQKASGNKADKNRR